MREIVTVQIGDFANFIGSHFWNFQDELLGLADQPDGDPIFKNTYLDMDVLYRTGETQKGILTYSPRLLSVGLQGSLGSLSPQGSLYHDTQSSNTTGIATWTGNVSRCVSEPREKNLYLQSLDEEEPETSDSMAIDPGKDGSNSQRRVQDNDLVESLENSVQSWTDFSKVHYHPRSLYELYGSLTDLQKFDNYGIGKDVLSEGLQLDEMNEILRFFVEECDHIQGFQFIVDDSGGFSGVAADFLENVADEYSNTPVLLYSARDPSAYVYPLSKKESISRALHDAVSFSRLSSLCKLMVPVGLPSLSRSKLASSLLIEDRKLFHSSAVYAASIHSISIPFRLEMLGPATNSACFSGVMGVGEIINLLAGQGLQNKVAILDAAMPAPCLTGDQNQRSFKKKLHSLTPNVEEDADATNSVESLVVHGALYSGHSRASIAQVKDIIHDAYGGEEPTPEHLHLSVALCPLPIPLPFPSIFRSHIGSHGEVLSSPVEGAPSKGSLDIQSIPMAARLRSSRAITPFIEKRLNNLCKYGTKRGAPGSELLRSWGFGTDDIEDMGEGLAKMSATLNPYHASSSDSD